MPKTLPCLKHINTLRLLTLPTRQHPPPADTSRLPIRTLPTCQHPPPTDAPAPPATTTTSAYSILLLSFASPLLFALMLYRSGLFICSI